MGILEGSVFMLPVYAWILLFLETYQSEGSDQNLAALFRVALTTLTVVLGASLAFQLL